MDNSLAYFMILNQAGLPFYAQSLQFESIKACQKFGGKIADGQPKGEDYLMGSYFSALQLYASDVFQSDLNLFDLGFSKFKIQGLVKNNVFFIGIFEIDPDNPVFRREVNDRLLYDISQKFFEQYPGVENLVGGIFNFQFDAFTELLIDILGIREEALSKRDCLNECSDVHNGCVPHHFFFKQLKLQETKDQVILDMVSADSI